MMALPAENKQLYKSLGPAEGETNTEGWHEQTVPPLRRAKLDSPKTQPNQSHLTLNQVRGDKMFIAVIRICYL